MEQNQVKTNINWYPGHMVKTKREIINKLKLIDIIYEVIDARIPYSSKIRDIDDITKEKPKILVFTKTDLCDIMETNKWINHYKDEGYKVITIDLVDPKGISNLLTLTEEVMKELDDNRRQKGMLKKKYRALVIGVPNVGKSTLINRLAGKKAAPVGNKPGITKRLGWIRVSDKLELLDSPGILWPKLEQDTVAYNLASMSAIKEDIIPIDDISIYILKTLYKYYPDKLKERYSLQNIDLNDITNTLDLIGKKRGALIKGGEIDYDKVYEIIYKDLKEGYFGGVTFDRYV
ncbi:MAG: ribosome biogenesis GTPase YlqF [Bacilli bacterium]|nr:ribosome biogenesis GTPase YlqF [Bacilli bacterium]